MRYIRIILTAWIIYASFYLCRVNYSIALPLINKELGISFTDLGLIVSVFFISYSLGQIVNGYLGVKYKPWKLVLMGIIGSSIITILFGLSSNFLILLLLWLLNGFFQSMGWPSLVKILSLTLDNEEVGKGYGIFNTSWALGHAISWLFTGFIIEWYGWRSGFIINGLIFLFIGSVAVSYLIMNDPALRDEYIEKRKERLNQTSMSRKSLGIVIILALIYLIMYAIRYALAIYLPSYLYSVERMIASTTFIATIFPLSGSLGMLFFGWLFDKLSTYNKAQFILFSTPFMALLLFLLPTYYEYNRSIGIVALIALSFLLYGLESQVISTMPVIIVGRKFSSLATGIIDSAGALGGFISSIVSGLIIDLQGFQQMLNFWSYIQVLQLLLTLILMRNVKKLSSSHA